MSCDSVSVTHTCDGRGCRAELVLSFSVNDDLLFKERIAAPRVQGWLRDDGKDYCPSCGAKLQAELRELKLQLIDIIAFKASMQTWCPGMRIESMEDVKRGARLFADTWVVPLVVALAKLERGEMWAHELRDIVHRENRDREAHLARMKSKQPE